MQQIFFDPCVLARGASTSPKYVSRVHQATRGYIITKNKEEVCDICEILWKQDLAESGKVMKGGETSEKEGII
jgi:hypothetical protein